MDVKSVTAIAVGIGLVAGAVFLGAMYMKHVGSQKWQGADALLKDRAVVWSTAKSYVEFRKELREYEPEQREALAASGITSERCTLLPAQRVRIIGTEGPMVMVVTLDREVWYTLPSQIEGDEEETDTGIEDRAKQMVVGR